MTHLEKLKKAKTASDFYAQLFEFEVELRKQKGSVDIFEWLNSDENPIKTLSDAVSILGDLAEVSEALDDLSDIINSINKHAARGFDLEWEWEDD